jgi:hypothetical protein
MWQAFPTGILHSFIHTPDNSLAYTITQAYAQLNINAGSAYVPASTVFDPRTASHLAYYDTMRDQKNRPRQAKEKERVKSVWKAI